MIFTACNFCLNISSFDPAGVGRRSESKIYDICYRQTVYSPSMFRLYSCPSSSCSISAPQKGHARRVSFTDSPTVSHLEHFKAITFPTYLSSGILGNNAKIIHAELKVLMRVDSCVIDPVKYLFYILFIVVFFMIIYFCF